MPLLDQAALDAVKQWQFQPTLLNGVAVPVIMTVTVNFTLGARSEADRRPLDVVGSYRGSGAAARRAGSRTHVRQSQFSPTQLNEPAVRDHEPSAVNFTLRTRLVRSSHTRQRLTIVSTALSMSCAETHSSREWKLCSPAKMFGVGRPMNDRRDPSVPPRMGRSTGVRPLRRIASRAHSTTSG